MKEKVRSILQEILPDVDFDAETALFDDGIIESFDVIQIMSELFHRPKRGRH